MSLDRITGVVEDRAGPQAVLAYLRKAARRATARDMTRQPHRHPSDRTGRKVNHPGFDGGGDDSDPSASSPPPSNPRRFTTLGGSGCRRRAAGVPTAVWVSTPPARGPGTGALSSPGFCGGWFIWCRWLPVVIVPGGGGRVPRRLRARRGGACRWRSVAGWCPYQWTHSAVATTGGVDVLPGSLVTDQLGLVQRVERFGQSEAERSLPWNPPRRPPRSRPGPARSE